MEVELWRCTYSVLYPSPPLPANPALSTALNSVIRYMGLLLSWTTFFFPIGSIISSFQICNNFSFSQNFALHKEGRERPAGQYGSFRGSIQLFSFLPCTHLQPQLLRGGQPKPPRKPDTARHSHFRKNKDAEWGGKKIIWATAIAQWEALIILCSLSFS